jgi:hypothetical protein
MTLPPPGQRFVRRGRAERIVNALVELLHTADDTRFLRWCLLDGDAARAAWAGWVAAQAGSNEAQGLAGRRLRAFAPLVLAAVACNDLDVDRHTMTVLRTRRLLEARRDAQYRTILRAALHALTASGVPHILLKGAGLADAVYPEPSLRHSHDIDVLVGDEMPEHDVPLLLAAGFAGRGEVRGGSRAWLHHSGLALLLHPTSCRIPYYRLSVAELREAAEAREVAGVRVRIPAPAHALVQVCAQAFAKGTGPLALWWAIDAWHLVRRADAAMWARVLGCATHQHLALPLAVTLTYLKRRLDARVPDQVVTALLDRAAPSIVGDRAAMVPLLACAPRHLAELWRLPMPWPARMGVLRAMLAPSSRYIQWAHGADHRAGGGLAALYLRRCLRLRG